MGAGPSFRSPFEALKVRESETGRPGVWGIREERRPIVSSHAFGETEVVGEVVTAGDEYALTFR